MSKRKTAHNSYTQIEMSGINNTVLMGNDSVVIRGNKNVVVKEVEKDTSDRTPLMSDNEMSIRIRGKNHIAAIGQSTAIIGDENQVGDFLSHIQTTHAPDEKKLKSLKEILRLAVKDSRMSFGIRMKLKKILHEMDNAPAQSAWEKIRPFLEDADTLGSILEHTVGLVSWLSAL